MIIMKIYQLLLLFDVFEFITLDFFRGDLIPLKPFKRNLKNYLENLEKYI